MGISEVWIDGQLDTTVDLYTVGSLWKQVLYTNNNLTHGQHTITIKPTNQKNPLSTGLYTDVDAFDVDNKEQEYCAPVAEANSLWWLDKKYDLGLFDTQTHTVYVTDVNQDGSKDILDLVHELAQLMGTNGSQPGTTVEGEQAGIEEFLTNHNLTNELYEHTVYDSDFPDPPSPPAPPYLGWLNFFHYLEGEVERSQDVKLDLGFYRILDCDVQGEQILWQRVGGHAVTVAGVDSQNFLFAISDPDKDAAEAGQPGVVRTPVGQQHPPYPHDSDVHNNEEYASHDIYTVWHSPSPGGKMGLRNYPPKENLPPEAPVWAPWPSDFTECIPQVILTEIETAVIVSPIICGNGNVDPGEECDDGNTNNGDGCSSICKWEPDIAVSPTSWGFGNVVLGNSPTKTFTVSNTGPGDLHITTITVTGANFSKQNDLCSNTTITPLGSCTVDVKFSSTAPLGLKSGTLSIPSDDPDENPLDVSLNGTAIAPAVTCSLIPSGTPPIQIMRGGILRFRVDIYNNENTTQTFKFATKIKLPSGTMYPYFLLGPVPVTLNANSSVGGNPSLPIPLSAPYGTYTYYGYVGNAPPAVEYGRCQFDFTVVQ